MENTAPATPFTLRDAGLSALPVLGVILLSGLVLSNLPGTETGTALAGTLLLQAGLMAGVAWPVLRRRLSWVETFGFQPARLPRAAAFGLGGYALMIPFLLLLGGLWNALLEALNLPVGHQPAIQWLTARRDIPFLVVFFLEAAILAPVSEEFFFRGLLESAFRSRLGPVQAALFTAVLFASFHAHLASWLPLFAIALILSAVYHASRSLAAAILLHSAYNILNFVWLLLAPATPGS